MIKLIHKLMHLLLVGVLVFSQGLRAQTTETTYYIPDALGSPIAAMDEAGNIKWRKHYQPFGKEIEQDAASQDNRIGYTGHVHDRSSGLTYMGARYYDPEIGRFLSMDPAAVNPNDPRTFNRYSYANNSPYNYVDPDGRNALVIEGIAIGLLYLAFAPGHEERVDTLKQIWAVYNEKEESDDNDPLEDVLDGAAPGDKTKGRTTNWDKSGGMDQANRDFDKLVPDGGDPIGDSNDENNGRKGVMEDGRKVNVRPNSTDGRPTVEIQNGKNRTKIRYND